MIYFLNIMLGIILCLIAIGYGNFLAFIYNRIKDKKRIKISHSSFFHKIQNRIKWYIRDKKRKSLTWCVVKGDFVKKSDCHCINVGDDCSGCYIYEQNRTDIFINFDEGDEPF